MSRTLEFPYFPKTLRQESSRSLLLPKTQESTRIPLGRTRCSYQSGSPHFSEFSVYKRAFITSTLLTMSRRLIALNNTGLENLRSGRFNEAISSFAHALECAKDLVDCHQEKQVMSLPEIPLFQCSMDFSNAIDLFALSPNNMFDVYKFGFALPKDPSTVRSANDVLFVIIFNMALTHHLAGLCFNRAANMSEALKYYKLTFASYHVSSSCRSGDAFLVLLGCVVNMGHIFSHFWRTQEVQACFDTLENLLDSPDVTTLSEQDGHFFFALLAYGETLSLNVAAAA